MLSRLLIDPRQDLVRIKLFTARLLDNDQAERNQTTYLEAPQARSDKIEIIEGRFQRKTGDCQTCGNQWQTYDEKETDANIVASIIEDGVRCRFDTAFLVSADGDLCPALRTLRRLRPDASAVVAMPPGKKSYSLGKEAHAVFMIGTRRIRQAMLPEQIETSDGTVLQRSESWK